MSEGYSYEKTLKIKPEDDYFNIQSYLLVTSKPITKFLYNTSVTPHQVILFAMVIGIMSAFLIIQDNMIYVIIGSVLLFYKNVFDKVDGSLARAKDMATRRGRFYDSISDFIVSLCLFIAIGYYLSQKHASNTAYIVSFLGLIFSMLQCSYFIYYQVAFIKLTGMNTINRLVESVTEADRRTQDKFTLFLQKIFMLIYGWQDILFHKFNNYLLGRIIKRYSTTDNDLIKSLWYSDKSFLTLTSLLGIGSHMVLIALFALMGKFEIYLFLNLFIWNLLLIFTVIYHCTNVNKRLNTLVKS